MVNIISTNAILSAKSKIAESSNAHVGVENQKLFDLMPQLPKDIIELSKEAKKALEAYSEYVTRAQISASDTTYDEEHTVFDKSRNQIKASSKFKAQLAVIEKKSELFEIMKNIQ